MTIPTPAVAASRPLYVCNECGYPHNNDDLFLQMYEKHDGFKEEDVHKRIEPNSELVMIVGNFYCKECGFSIFEKVIPQPLTEEDIKKLRRSCFTCVNEYIKSENEPCHSCLKGDDGSVKTWHPKWQPKPKKKEAPP